MITLLVNGHWTLLSYIIAVILTFCSVTSILIPPIYMHIQVFRVAKF
jgi:hypothetical protein